MIRGLAEHSSVIDRVGNMRVPATRNPLHQIPVEDQAPLRTSCQESLEENNFTPQLQRFDTTVVLVDPNPAQKRS